MQQRVFAEYSESPKNKFCLFFSYALIKVIQKSEILFYLFFEFNCGFYAFVN